MANYYQNNDGTTSIKGNGRNFIQQADGSTFENTVQKRVDKKKKKNKNQENTFSTAVKNLKDNIQNSSVKNYGLSFSTAISDIANISDAAQDVIESTPFIGNVAKGYKVATKTGINAATNMGIGAMRSVETAGDFVSDLITNPIELGTNYALDYLKSGKKVANENLKDLKKMQKRYIKKNITNDFLKKSGYNNVVDDLEKDSLIKRNNIGGQVAQSVGGMVPSLVIGQAVSAPSPVIKSTNGLKGADKAKTILSNVGKSFASQLPSSTILGASSYGSGLEDALNSGADINSARMYAIGNSAKEMATEWITGGIPGLNGKGGLDLPVEKLIDKSTGKIKNKYAQAIAKTVMDYGYKFVGEGLEEGLSDIIDPYLKNSTYSKGEKVNWENVFNSFIVGGIAGGLLDAPEAVSNFNQNISNINNNSSNVNTQQPILPTGSKNDNIKPVDNPLTNDNISTMLPLDTNTIKSFNNQNISTNSPDINQQTNILMNNNRENQLNNQNINSTNNLQSQNPNVDLNNYRFEYHQSENPKIDNFRKSANQFMNNSNETKSFVQTVEKVINDKGYNITFDNSIGDNVNGRIGINDSGEVDIKINPNSDRAGEFILTHEITHAIDTKEMQNLVIDYANKNSEFNEALEALKQTYGVDDVNDEVLADISGQLFGTEEFINKLSTTKPSLFKKIYDKIIGFANKITGNSRESLFIKDLKNKWEKAYRQSDLNTARENLNNNEKLSLSKNALQEVSDVVKQTREEAETDNRQFVKLKDNTIKALVDYGIKDLPMLERNSHVRENILTEEEAKKLGYSTKNKHFHGLGVKTYLEIIDSMDNPIAVYQYTDKGKYSTDNFIVVTPVEINGKKSIVPVEINSKGQYNQVEIDFNKIKSSYLETKNNYLNTLLQEGKIKEIFTQSGAEQTSLSTNNIPQNEKNVNNFKEKQLEIIKNNNPVEDDYHTWIRNVDDIKTLSETLEDSDWSDYDEFNPDLTRADIDKALETGKITVYSSYPIEQGIFISPSKMEAESYSADGKVYSKEVNIDDVAWIDPTQGQYAKVDTKDSLNNSSWQEHLEKNYKSKGTKTNFEDTRLDTNNTEQNLINKETDRLTKKYEREKNKNKKIITKEASKILEFDDYQQKRKFTDLVSEYYDNPDLNKIKQDIRDNFSEKRIEYVNDYVKDIKNVIRGTDLQITDYVRRNLTDFGNFRKENFNKLKLKNQGQSIDSFYNELAEDYPSVFSKDITNEVDQLERMSEFMNEDDKFYEKYNLDDNAINEAAQYVYGSIKNKDNIDDLINSISISPKQIRREKTIEYREYAENFVNNSEDWVDKKLGLSYKTNTMKRNFYDVMGKKDGGRLYHSYIEPIFNHNAQMQNDISTYNEKIGKLKLNDKESTAVQMFGEYKYNPETLVTGMEVDEFITKNKLDHKKIENAVEVFRSTYDELIERVNETLKSQGYKEIEYRKGYFPHFVEEGAKTKFGKVLEKMGWKFKDDSVPTDIAGITDTFKPGKVWNRNAQQRKGKYTDFNALKGFDNYVRGAMETIYFTEDIQKLRALENEIRYQHSEKGVQTQIDEILSDTSIDFEERQEKIDKIFTKYKTPLNNLVSEIRDYTNSIANKKSILDRTMEQATNRKVYSVMQNISSRLSANMVGLNLSSAITNFIPITQATSQVKSKYLLKGLRESIKNQAVADNFESKSVFLTSRLNEADKLFKTRLEKFSEKANFMFEGIDSITANTIVRGKYYENIANGMSEYNAMRNADEFARDLMAGRTKGEMPTIFNSKNPFVKLFTSFQLEVNNQYQYMFKDLPRDLADETKKKLIAAFAKMFFGAWIYNQLTEKVVGRKAAFSPADTIKEIYDTSTDKNLKINEKSSNILEKLTQDVPFVGSLVGGGRLPISSVANPLNVIKGESTFQDEAKKLLYYTVLPFGGGQIKKTIEGASMYSPNKKIKGSYNSKGQLKFEADKTPSGVAKALLFGQYSGENAADYFDNNRIPLSEKQQKDFEKLNIPLTEFRKYQDDKKN